MSRPQQPMIAKYYLIPSKYSNGVCCSLRHWCLQWDPLSKLPTTFPAFSRLLSWECESLPRSAIWAFSIATTCCLCGQWFSWGRCTKTFLPSLWPGVGGRGPFCTFSYSIQSRKPVPPLILQAAETRLQVLTKLHQTRCAGVILGITTHSNLHPGQRL